VAIITTYFWPEQTGISQTVGEFAAFLTQRGMDVRVATAMPYYPQWQIWPDYRGAIWRTEQREGMTIYRSWHLVSPTPSTLTRVLHEATLSLFAIPNLIRALRRADVAYIVSPALLCALTGLIVATAFRVRRVLVVKDVMPDAAVELGMLRSPLMISASRWLARRAYALASEIQTLAEGMRRRIARETREATKVRIVPDTIDVRELEPVPSGQNEFRRRFVSDGAFAVLHTGNIGKKQDLDLLLRAAGRLRDESGIHFYVFGDGAMKGHFLQRLADLGLENVSHYPLQERWMLRHMLSGADVVLVSQRAEVVDIVMPSKLITALGAGAMIVASCAADSESARVVREGGGGIVTSPGDDEALVQLLLRIRRGEVNTEQYRERARSYASRRFDREAVYGPIADALIHGREIRSTQLQGGVA
jgi:colanic acid biosynthesis glycosyl transferase WcaI